MRALLRSWLPVIVAFVLGTAVTGTAVALTVPGPVTIAGALAAKTMMAKTVSGNVVQGKVVQGRLVQGRRMKAGRLTVRRAVSRGTVKARDFEYRSPRANRLVVPASAFVDSDGVLGGPEITTGAVTFTGAGTAVAPPSLPDGATLTRVQAFYGAGSTGTVNLLAHNQSGTPTTAASMTLDSSCVSEPCSVGDTSIAGGTINNRREYYGIQFDAGAAGGSLFEVIITYTVRRPGPASG